MDTTRRTLLATAVPVAAFLLPSVALSYVPTVVEALNRSFPSQFIADLSGCDRPLAKPGKVEPLDERALAQRLRGTWALRTVTVEGDQVSLGSNPTALYLDLPGARSGEKGAALRLEGPAGRTVSGPPTSGEPMAGFWELGLARAEDHLVTLTLGEPAAAGSAGPSAAAASSVTFGAVAGVFAAVRSAAAGSRWDKMVLTDTTFTLVSCENARVERFVKTSSARPQLAGLGLREYWQKIAGSIARGSGPNELALGARR